MPLDERCERVASSGRDVALKLENERHVFEMPEPLHADRVFLTSRYWTPAQVKSKPSSDGRVLGVAVRKIWFDDQEAPLDSPALTDGWYGEDKGSRWTNGCATVELRGVKPRKIIVELDPRRKGVYKEGQIILPPDRTLAMAFESLGDNCEFGMFQRRLGAEPLGFLRFSGARLPHLLRGLDEAFSGIGVLTAKLLGTEFMIQVDKYNYQYHSGRHAPQSTADQVLADQKVKLEFQRRAFFENLRDPYKLYVFKQNEPVARREMDRLLDALRRHGPCCLLWVTEQDQEHPAGHAALIADGFIRAYIDKLAPRESAGKFSTQGWLRVMRAAYEIWTGERVQNGYQARLI